MGKTYFYYYSYDPKDDSFYAFVDDGIKSSTPVISIDDTDEMVYYISSGTMLHIDDVDGLENHLKSQGYIQDEDTLLISEQELY